MARVIATKLCDLLWLTLRQERKQYAAKGGAIYRYGRGKVLK
jgi:hypothetical protein